MPIQRKHFLREEKQNISIWGTDNVQSLIAAKALWTCWERLPESLLTYELYENIPNPRMEPRSAALQADSLAAELAGEWVGAS